MVERRAKGLCYNCDESYSIEYKCKRLFWIEVPDTDSEPKEDMAGDPKISINSINRTHDSPTMQLLTKVSDITISVLVDSGRTQLSARRFNTKFGT